MITKLFIDFDGTLFDTAKLRDATFVVLGKAGFDRSEILSVYQAECLDYKFSITGFLERFTKIRPYNRSLADVRINNLYESIAADFLYPDAVEFLKNLDHNKYEVDLLSMGDLEFQKLKVKHSGLAEYFDNLFFTDIQKWDYMKNFVDKNERFVIIDDRSDTVHKISENFPKSLCLELDRKGEDKYDPARNGQLFNNISAKNLKQAAMYLD